MELPTTTATERSGRWSVAAPAKAWIYGWLCRRIGVGPHPVGRPDRPGHPTDGILRAWQSRWVQSKLNENVFARCPLDAVCEETHRSYAEKSSSSLFL